MINDSKQDMLYIELINIVPLISSWQFSTDADVGFGVYLRTADVKQKAKDMEEIVSSSRVNSHMVVEDGRLTCQKTGTCKSEISMN